MLEINKKTLKADQIKKIMQLENKDYFEKNYPRLTTSRYCFIKQEWPPNICLYGETLLDLRDNKAIQLIGDQKVGKTSLANKLKETNLYKIIGKDRIRFNLEFNLLLPQIISEIVELKKAIWIIKENNEEVYHGGHRETINFIAGELPIKIEKFYRKDEDIDETLKNLKTII